MTAATPTIIRTWILLVIFTLIYTSLLLSMLPAATAKVWLRPTPWQCSAVKINNKSAGPHTTAFTTYFMEVVVTIIDSLIE